MKFNRTHWLIPVILVFCVAALAQSPLPTGRSNDKTTSFATTTAVDAVNTQANLQLIQVLESGKEVMGSVPASIVVNECQLAGKQYRIDVVGGDKKLRVVLGGSTNVDLYVRRNAPVAIEAGKIVSDFKAVSSGAVEAVSIPSQEGPPVQPGSYFIAISNCSMAAADYRLTAVITGPPDVDVFDLATASGFVLTGTIPTPVPGNCGISRTQYKLTDGFSMCGDSGGFFITINADQNVNVVFRRDKPVAVENGVLMYDGMSENQVKIHHLNQFQTTPGTGTFFVAILNCGFEPVNYTLSGVQIVADPFFMTINNVSLKKKKLFVTGFGLEGATVLIDGEPQKTVDGGRDENFFDVLIVKNAKKKLPRNQTVIVMATRFNPCSPDSNGFAFTRH